MPFMLITISSFAALLVFIIYAIALWKLWRHPQDQGRSAFYSIILTILVITAIGLIIAGCWVFLIYSMPSPTPSLNR